MGMYANIEGHEVKMTGLLAKAVVHLASANPQQFPGVTLTWHSRQFCLDGGVVTLSRENVREVVIEMRNKFVHQGRTREYVSWAQDASLTHIQDIYQFRADAEAFTVLADWHVFERGDEIIFS